MKFQNPCIHGSKDMRGRESAKTFKSDKGIIYTISIKCHQKLIKVIYIMITDCLQNFMNLSLGFFFFFFFFFFAYNIFLC